MKSLIILIEMIFLHFIADYQIQGILAKMKQKKWWANSFANDVEFSMSKYKKDYKAALLAHAFEWTFITILPLLYKVNYENYSFRYSLMYLFLFCGNTICHYVIDDWKANKRKVNLIQDQIFHLEQIVISWGLWWAFIGWN